MLQPHISDQLGALWIEARYDAGAMPESVYRVIRAARARPAPPRETAMSAALIRARQASAVRGTRRPTPHA